MSKRHIFNGVFFCLMWADFFWLLPRLRPLADLRLRFALGALSLILIGLFSEIRYSYEVSGTIIWNKVLAAKLVFLSFIVSLIAATWTFPIFEPYTLPIIVALMALIIVYNLRFRRIPLRKFGVWLVVWLVMALFAVMLYWGALRVR